MKSLLSFFILGMLLMLGITPAAYAQEVVENVEPVMSFIAIAIKFINTTFPVAGPYIQGAIEVIFSLSAFFTLLSAFVIGVLKLPLVVARVSGSQEWVIKIEKFSAKVGYYLKYFSSFNATKKK